MFYMFAPVMIIGGGFYALLTLSIAQSGRIFAEKRVMSAAFLTAFGMVGLITTEILRLGMVLVLTTSLAFGLSAMGLALIFLELLRKRYETLIRTEA